MRPCRQEELCKAKIPLISLVEARYNKKAEIQFQI